MQVAEFDAMSVDRGCFALMPLGLAQRLHAIPFEKNGPMVSVALADPEDILAIDDLRLALGHYDVHFYSTSPGSVEAALARWAKLEARTAEGAVVEEIAADQAEVEDEAVDDEGRTSRLVNQILDQAIAAGASDIHFEPNESTLSVRFRVDGALRSHASYPKSVTGGLVNRLKVMGGMDVAERRVPQDGRFNRRLEKSEVDCRVVTIPTSWKLEGAVVRLFDQSRSARNLDQVGFRPQLIERFREVLKNPHGAILVTGPTGSGKTTTLYASLTQVARDDRKTLAVEDPVEIRFPSITQVQVNEKAGLTFVSALRSFLRADPDVILVGEIRDKETAELAAQASLTGHLVLSTLHTNEAAGAPTRLADLGLAPFVVSSALKGILAQRLVRRLCVSCKHLVAVSEMDLWGVGWPDEWPVPESLYAADPDGCRDCEGIGYSGRIAVGELIVVDDAIADAINRSVPAGELERLAHASGTIPLRLDALGWVNAGVTSLDEIARAGL